MNGAKVLVNGEERLLAADTTLEELLADVVPDVAMSDDGRPRGVAVALNESVIPRGAWGSTRIRPGDHLEILKAVQGG